MKQRWAPLTGARGCTPLVRETCILDDTGEFPDGSSSERGRYRRRYSITRPTPMPRGSAAAVAPRAVISIASTSPLKPWFSKR